MIRIIIFSYFTLSLSGKSRFGSSVTSHVAPKCTIIFFSTTNWTNLQVVTSLNFKETWDVYASIAALVLDPSSNVNRRQRLETPRPFVNWTLLVLSFGNVMWPPFSTWSRRWRHPPSFRRTALSIFKWENFSMFWIISLSLNSLGCHFFISLFQWKLLFSFL